jgi:hypothetical protein
MDEAELCLMALLPLCFASHLVIVQKQAPLQADV